MTATIIILALAAVLFGVLWYQGQLKRFAAYVQETREELRKCTWPSWEELKESTVLVMVVTVLIGAFTFVADVAFGFITQRLI
jgi:preprotein translocase subunit SecE